MYSRSANWRLAEPPESSGTLASPVVLAQAGAPRRPDRSYRVAPVFFQCWLILLSLGAGLTPLSAEAAVYFWENRGDLGVTDSIDWSDLGVAYTVVSQPFAIQTAVRGWSAGVAKATAGAVERRDQGDGWSGNFAPGDALLWTQDSAGPLSLTFSIPVGAVGMQIQKADQSNPIFYATIEAFDASDTSLGAFEREGYSSNTGDGSALFIGIHSTEPNIARIDVNVLFQFDFAINQVSLVPEPRDASWAACGALGALVIRRLHTHRASVR